MIKNKRPFEMTSWKNLNMSEADNGLEDLMNQINEFLVPFGINAHRKKLKSLVQLSPAALETYKLGIVLDYCCKVSGC